MPLISVIIAVFNAANTLQRCIDSFVYQNYSFKELIIVDGGSTDGTLDLIKTNHNSINCWISEPDGGVYHALNKGIRMANGEWIIFLGADDYFFDANVLTEAANFIEGLRAHTLIIYGRVMVADKEENNVCLIGKPWTKKNNRFLQIILKMPHQGIFHKKDIFEKHGLFDESLRIIGDNELLLRELKAADPVFLPRIVVSVMRQGGISSNIKNAFLVLKETVYIARKHNQSLPIWYWCTAVAKAFVKMMFLYVIGDNYALKLINYYSQIKRNKFFIPKR